MKTLLSAVLMLVSVVAMSWPAVAEDIPLRNVDGFYKAPVKLNGVVTLDFALDTGASDVSMSDDVVNSLIASGAMSQGDIKGQRTYMLADGSPIKCRALVVRSMQLGSMEAKDVDGSTCPGKALLLLGQSFFRKLGSVSIDFQKNLMIVKSALKETLAESPVAAKMPEPPPTVVKLPEPSAPPPVEPPRAKLPKPSAAPPPVAAAGTCDFDVGRIVNGATLADSDTVWSCRMGKEPYDVAPLQLFADGTGIGYAAGSGKFTWRTTGCRSIAYNFNIGNQSFEAKDIYGDLNYGTFTMTFSTNDPKEPFKNAVCVKQQGRVNEQAVTQVQVVSPSRIDPSCKLLQKGDMKDDIITILNTAAQKGATYVAYGQKKGANVAISMYQCERGGKDLKQMAAHALSMGDAAKAKELFEKALEANPSDIEVINGLAVMYGQRGDLRKSQELLEKALAINPASDLAIANLGLLYDEKGESAKARELFEKALAINPNNVTALDGLGLVFGKQGDLAQARALLEKALTLNPNNARSLYNLAIVYEQQFEKAKAVEMYKKFLNSGAPIPPDLANKTRQHVLELEK